MEDRKKNKIVLLAVMELLDSSDEENIFVMQLINRPKKKRGSIKNYVEKVVPRFNLDGKCYYK